MIERIGDNAPKLKLLGDILVSVTFSVDDLAPYVEDNIEDLRVNPSQERETDAYHGLSLLLATPSPSPSPRSMPTFLD